MDEITFRVEYKGVPVCPPVIGDSDMVIKLPLCTNNRQPKKEPNSC